MLDLILLLATAAPAAHGIDVAGMNKAVAAGDDFDAQCNASWVETNPIPADRSSWGPGAMLSEQTRKRVVDLIQEAARKGADADAKKVGDYYASFMDEAAIEKKGLAPLQPQLDAVAAIADAKQLAKAIGASIRADTDALNATDFHTDHLFGLWVVQALDNPKLNQPYMMQGGLGMPEREYNVSPAPKVAELRKAYQQHVAKMFELAGLKDGAARAERVMKLETKIAEAHASLVDSQEPKNVQAWKRDELAKKAPGLDWPALLYAAGLSAAPRIWLWQPKATVALAALVASEPLESWKDWLALHLVDDSASVLPKAFVEESFAFYGKTMSGTPKERDRWKRAADSTNDALGEVVGKLYVGKYFGADAKAKAKAMVDDLVEAFGRRVDGLEWMSPKTKARAKEKLATLIVGVGYPDRWRDYAKLEIVREAVPRAGAARDRVVRGTRRLVTRAARELRDRRHHERRKLRERDLNPRPSGYEPDALPACAIPR